MHSEAIRELARERPDILLCLIRETFLPYSQLAAAITALEESSIPQEELTNLLKDFFSNESSTVREATARVCGLILREDS